MKAPRLDGRGVSISRRKPPRATKCIPGCQTYIERFFVVEVTPRTASGIGAVDRRLHRRAPGTGAWAKVSPPAPKEAAGPLSLLLVEDNPADARLLREAFAEAGIAVRIDHAADAEGALRRLRAGARPDVVVLDLNMPRVDGRALLRELRSDPQLVDLEVIVLTSSHYDRDLRTCRQLAVRDYLVKPTDFDEMVGTARRIAGRGMGHRVRRS
jgi:two-component system, chemotaxis family, response regulator Rcp1